MPKIVGKNERGFVDPLSLFGLLFLVVTLAAVTFVTANKGFSLNIAEKAGVGESPDYDVVANLPPTAGNPSATPTAGNPLTNPSTTTPSTGSGPKPGEFGYVYPGQTDNGLPYIAGTYVYNGKRYLVASNGTAEAASKYYNSNPNKIVAANFSDSVKKALNLDAILEASQQPTQTTTTTTTPATSADKRFLAKDCSEQGGKYDSRSGACTTTTTSQTVEKTDEGFITHSTTYVRDAYTGIIIPEGTKTTSYIAKTTTTSTQNQGNTVNTSLTSYLNPDTGQYYTDASGKAIVNITGLSIIPPSAKKTGGTSCSDSSECGSGICGSLSGRGGISKACIGNAPVASVPLSDKRSVGQGCTDSSECGSGSCGFIQGGRAQASKTCQREILPDNNYGSCNGDPTCNSALTSIDRGMNAISFGGWSNYVDAYSPDKVVHLWQQAGYDSLDDCRTKKAAVPTVGRPTLDGCNDVLYTQEQVTTSIQLGTTLVAEGAAIAALPAIFATGSTVAVAGGGALQIGGAVLAPALTSFGAISTLQQTSAAAVAQIIDPGSTEAWKATGYAALSWANIGTADKLLKTFAALEKAGEIGQATTSLVKAAQSARNLNNLVTVANLGVDAPNAYNTCNESGILTGSCGGALSAVVMDIGFGFLDFKQGQLGFGNPLEKINIGGGSAFGPQLDVPNPNDTRIASPAQLNLLDQLATNPLANVTVTDLGNGSGSFLKSEQLDMFDLLTSGPTANVSTVTNNGPQLAFPNRPASQDPNTNFNLTKTDPNEASALAIFSPTAVTELTAALLLPSNLSGQIPNTPQLTGANLANAPNADLTAPKPVEPNANIAEDITKPLSNTVEPPTTGQTTTKSSWFQENIANPIGNFFTGNPIPKTLDTATIPANKTLVENLFGESKTVDLAKVNTETEIVIKPGDTITTNGHEYKLEASEAKGTNDPDLKTWYQIGDGPVQELTPDGIKIPKNNNGLSVEITLSVGYDSSRELRFGDEKIRVNTKTPEGVNTNIISSTIARANPEPGLLSTAGLTKAWDDNVVKPLDNFLFGNPLPKTLDTAKVPNNTSTNVVINERDLQFANSEIIGPSKLPTQTGDELIGQIRADQADILSKTDLPHPSLITKNPDLYTERVQAIAKENGFEITTLSANPTIAEIKNAGAEVVIKLSNRYDALVAEDVLAYRVGLATEDLNTIPAKTVPHPTAEQDIVIQKSADTIPTDAELEAVRIKNASLEYEIRLALYTDTIDPATDLKLLNKLGGEQELNNVLRNIPAGSPVIVVDLGLSNLKKVNDTFGHEVGDVLLVESARIIDSTVAASGVPGARVVHIKGKEYRLILPGADEATAKRILDQITTNTNAEALRLQSLGNPDVKIFQNMGFDYGIAKWDGVESTSEFAKRAADTRVASEAVRKAQELELALANPTRAPSLFEKFVKDDQGWFPWLRSNSNAVAPIEKEILGPSEIPTGNNLTSKVANDQASLLNDTGIPHPELITKDPTAYVDGLNKVIDDNGLTKIEIPTNPTRQALEIAGAKVERMMIEKYESHTPPKLSEYKAALVVTDPKNFPLNIVPQLDPAVKDAVFRSASEELQLLQQRTLNLEAALNDAKYKDPMTGLYNKAGGDLGMAVIIDAAKATNGRVAIINIDVSGLGAINNNPLYGHEAGDQLLIMAADIFDNTPRRSTDIVFRIGDGPDAVKIIHSHGDEFAIILPGTDEIGAKKIFDRLYEELAARKAANPENSILQELNFDAGIAHWDGTETAEQLVNRADEAMYVNKVARKAAQEAADKPSLLDNIFNGIKKFFSPTPVENITPAVPQANTELTNGANEIAKKYTYKSVNIDDSKLTTRIDIADDGFQEGSTADVYRYDINVDGVTKPAAVKLFITNHETIADVLSMAETEARNSQIAKAILGDDAVDFYGIVTTKDGRVGLSTQLIENGSNNPVTQKTVDDLLRIQSKLLKEGYYVKDFQFLREPDGSVKVFDFWLLNKISDQTSELEGFAKKYGVDISLVKQDPVKYITLENNGRGAIFLGPQKSAVGIATNNGFTFEIPKYEFSPSVEIPPIPVFPPPAPKPSLFGYEFNGFKNEEGKFILWPLEKTNGPINVTEEFATLNKTSDDTGTFFSEQSETKVDTPISKTDSKAVVDINNALVKGEKPVFKTQNGEDVVVGDFITNGGMSDIHKGTYQGEDVIVKVAKYQESEKIISEEFGYINNIRNALIDAGRTDLTVHIINPKAPIVDADGKVIGYVMNELTDTTLGSLILKGQQGLTAQDIKDFKDIAKILDDAGLPFGDIYPNNIAKDKNGVWIMYDPISPNTIESDEAIYKVLTTSKDAPLPSHIVSPGTNIIKLKDGRWLYEVPTGNVDAFDTMLKTFDLKPNDSPLPWANEYVNTSIDNISQIPSVKTTVSSPYIVMGAFTGLVGITYAYDKVSEYFGYDLVNDQTFTDLWKVFIDLFATSKNTLPAHTSPSLTNVDNPPQANPPIIPASPAKTSEQILQEFVLGITSSMHATTPDELAKLFASIGANDAYVGSDGSLICGPLSLEILKRLGIYTGDVNMLYQFEPGTEWDKLLTAFPDDKFTITNTLAENHSIGDMKYWIDNPLKVGDFLFLEVSGSSRGFDHMLVVDRVDSQGRVYSTTNHFTIENGVTTYVVDQVLLYDPTNPNNPDAMFNKWTDRTLLNVNGNTGSGGFLVIRALPTVINSITGTTTTNTTNYAPLDNDPGHALDRPPSGLTSKGDGQCQRIGNTYCDGQRMYELYTWYKDQPNGWWNANGGDFTPADFLAMTLVAEATSTNPDPKLLKSISEATANQLWASSPEHKPYCTTPDCEAGIFNFIGDYMMSAGLRYNATLTNNGNPSSGTVQNLTAGQDIYESLAANGMTLSDVVNITVYNPNIDTSVHYNDLPTQWGCVGCGDADMNWTDNANNANASTVTTDRCGIYYQGGGDVVYTNNQKYNWTIQSCN